MSHEKTQDLRVGLRCHVRFTDEEFEKIKKHKEYTGKTVPQLLKQAYFSKQIVLPLLSLVHFRDLIIELKRIGNNVNQIARKLNSESEKPELFSLLKLNEELSRIRALFTRERDQHDPSRKA